jgi:Spy/CpxP family protein refolding chaperone
MLLCVLLLGGTVGAIAAVGFGQAAADVEVPKAKPDKVRKTAVIPAPPASAKAARERLAESLGLTDFQRDAMQRAHEELDVQRAALLVDMDPVLAAIKSTLLDESSTAEQKAKARRRLDDLHQEFRRIEGERKSRLEALLSPEQKRKLEDLVVPPAEAAGATVVPQQVLRVLRKYLSSPELDAALRRSKETLERKAAEAEKMKQGAVEDFYQALLPLLNDTQRAEVESLRKRLEKAKTKTPAKTAEKPGATVAPAKP